MKTFNVWVVALVFAFSATAADVLTEKLQRGLFEEEANHNLDAAIKEYQSVVSQSDEQRKVMATALFRLGECYRKLGRTNEANAHYERILRDFSEQEQLVKLSRLQLPSRAREAGRLPGAVAEDHASVKLLREEITLVEQQVRNTEAQLNAGRSTLDELLRVKQDVLRLKRMLPENTSPTQQKTLLEEQVGLVQKLLNEVQRRVDVGRAPSGEEVPLKRELLALQRELSVVSDVATSSGATISPENSMTQAESEALARAKTLARNSPDLLQNPTREGLGELQLGARDGFYSVVEFILAQGVSANGPERGTPPIVLAAKTGHLRIVQLLLDKGADVNAIGGGYTALMNACENGYRAVVELLLQRGADVNRVGSSTALHKVAAKGYAGIAELLLARGAKPDALIGSNQETPLQMAVNNGFADVAELLLKAGADVTISDRAGVTALHTAASRGNTNLAARLLDKGAKPNAEDAEGKTPLFNALNGYRPVEMVRLLLARGADVNQRHVIKRNGQNMSHYPLIEAVAAGHREIVDAMIEAKADLSVVNQGLTPLMVSVQKDRADLVESLLRAGANPNQDTSSEPPPLFYAVSRGQGLSQTQAQTIVEMLLKHGADPNFVNKQVQTPLVVATQPEILQLLLDYKADPNKGNPLPELLRRRTASGWPAATFPGAPGYGTPQKPPDYPAIEVLLKGGANPNATFGDGTRLLMWAVSTQDGKLVELLLKHGAEVNFVGNNETPLSLAQRNVQSATASRSTAQAIEQAEQIEKALRKHGANEYLQRLSSISYTRPAWTGSDGKTVFTRGTNDYNRHTLFEMLAAVFTANDQPVFPDLARVTIERLEGTNPKRKEVALNIDELIRTGNCSNNLWLEWGDRLSLPETDHPLDEQWRGLPDETRELVSKCLARRVSIVVKQETNMVKLVQNWNVQSGGYGGVFPQPVFAGASIAQPPRFPRQPVTPAVTKNPDKSLSTFRLKEVVYGANVLRASSDPTRVRVTRRDGETVKEWVFDLSRLATANEWNSQAVQSQAKRPPWEDLWLRDGDVIEIPEKQ